MAGDWLKVEISTPDKPEILLMADDLNIDPGIVFYGVFKVWSWFDQHTQNGHAPSVTAMSLDRQIGVAGFCKSMIKHDWMIEEGDVIILPNFDRHNGESSKKRALSAKRKKKQRSNVVEVSTDERDKGVTREEKRREEKNKDINNIPSTQKPKPPKEKKYVFSNQHMSLATQMSCAVITKYPPADYPNMKIDLDVWAETVRMLVEIDKHSILEIETLWRWIWDLKYWETAPGDFRWWQNCQTPMKLRKRKKGEILQYFDVIDEQRLRSLSHQEPTRYKTKDEELREHNERVFAQLKEENHAGDNHDPI